jgi:hypothetical protein
MTLHFDSLFNRSKHPFDGKARRKETVGTPRYKWEDNIKMDLREIG